MSTRKAPLSKMFHAVYIKGGGGGMYIPLHYSKKIVYTFNSREKRDK